MGICIFIRIYIFLLVYPIFMVFRMANLKLMTEEEREAYFNRPESLKERIVNFRSDSYFSYVESFVGKIPGWIGNVSEASFNYMPVIATYLIWRVCYAERFAMLVKAK